MYIKPPKFVIDVLLWALGISLFVLAAHFLLPWLLPFLIAFALAALLEPAVRFLMRRGSFPRAVAAGLCTLLLGGVLVWLAVFAAGRGIDELARFTARLPEMLSGFASALERLEEFVLRYIGSAPKPVAEYMQQAMDAAAELFASVPAQLSGKLPGLITAAVEKTPAVLLFSVTAGLGTYFISSSYPQLLEFVLRQVPDSRRETLFALRDELKATLGRWLRAQFLLMAATFALLFGGFLILGISYGVVIAFATAVIDALPILGAGTVLIPWALVCFLTGNYTRGAGLLVCYGAVTLLRSVLQAKLVGDQLGLHPVVSLFSIYLGFCICGVIGMLLFPIAATVLVQLNRRGIIKLWK